LDAMVDRLGLPMMLKPDQSGSALGAQVVRDAADLPAAMVGCLAYGETVLAEKFVTGVEVAVAVFEGADGPVALPAVEIEPKTGVYDYTARYTAGLIDFHTPARLAPDTAAAVADLAVAAHRLLGLRDVSRTDAIVAADGTVYFLEVASSPGLTETSLLPMAAEVAGRSLGDIYAGLIERAVARAQ
jgi:D-alanine-D-alanine ligase